MIVAPLFLWRRSDASISSVLSCNPFCSCVSSYSSATWFAAIAYRPIIPLTMNYVVSGILSTRSYKNTKVTIYRCIFLAKRDLRGNPKKLIITWAALDVTYLLNWAISVTWITPMSSRNIYSSGISSKTSFTRLAACTDNPIIPHTIHYTAISSIYTNDQKCCQT